jgi:hypothetical protein
MGVRRARSPIETADRPSATTIARATGCVDQVLLGAQVSLGGLNGRVAEEQFDLL